MEKLRDEKDRLFKEAMRHQKRIETLEMQVGNDAKKGQITTQNKWKANHLTVLDQVKEE